MSLRNYTLNFAKQRTRLKESMMISMQLVTFSFTKCYTILSSDSSLIFFVEQKLRSLQQALDSKNVMIRSVSSECADLKTKLSISREKLLGIGLRCLKKSVTSEILSYLVDEADTGCIYFCYKLFIVSI